MANNIFIWRYTALSFLTVFLSSWFGPLLYKNLKANGLLSSSVNFEITEIVITFLILLYLFFRFPLENKNSLSRRDVVKSMLWIPCGLAVILILENFIIKAGTNIYENIYRHEVHKDIPSYIPTPLEKNSYFWAWFSPIVAFPILEELTFRGFLFAIWSRILKPWQCIFVTTIFFSLAHLTSYFLNTQAFVGFLLKELPSIFLSGIFLGAVRYRYSIAHSIMVHISINAFAYLLIYLTLE